MTAPDWLVLDTAAPSAEEPLARFFAGTADDELLLPFCGNGHPLDFDQVECERPECGERSPEWRPVPKSGTVIASIVMHRLEKAYIAAKAPYPVLEVEFDSGHRLYLSTDRDPGAVAYQTGERVDIAFVSVGGIRIPRVRSTEKRSG